MTTRPALRILLACALALAGCGGDETATAPPVSTVPDRPPTAAQLARIASTPAHPFFWLGPSHEGQALTRGILTATEPPDSIFQYGPPTCRARVGCSYRLGVATLRDRAPDTTQRCWRRLGPALVLGCDRGSELRIYSGSVEVFLSSTAVKPARVALALRIKAAGAAVRPRLAGLAAPQRFTCEEARDFPPRFRAQIPAQLAPGSCS